MIKLPHVGRRSELELYDDNFFLFSSRMYFCTVYSTRKHILTHRGVNEKQNREAEFTAVSYRVM